jgi:hypothetical protein
LIIDAEYLGELYTPREGEVDDAGCFTVAYFKRVLPPTPDWMRKPPKLKPRGQSKSKPKQQRLFDDE